MSAAVRTAAALLALVLMPLSAWADDKFVEPELEVHRLNEDAVRLAIAGDLEGAVAIFEQSLALQELNVTWLNLGRTFARMGRCAEAKEAYDRTVTAPKVRDPSPEEVLAAVYTYSQELAEKCRETPAEADPVVVAPAPTTPPAAAPLSFSPWSWVLVASGSAMLVTAAVLDGVVLEGQFEDLDAANRDGDRAGYDDALDAIDSTQTANLALFTVGGLALAAGAALVVTELVLAGASEPAPAGAASLPSFAISGEGATLGWLLTW